MLNINLVFHIWQANRLVYIITPIKFFFNFVAVAATGKQQTGCHQKGQSDHCELTHGIPLRKNEGYSWYRSIPGQFRTNGVGFQAGTNSVSEISSP